MRTLVLLVELLQQALCEKLLAIEYIDVAEQAIVALEKISAMFPQVGGVRVGVWLAIGSHSL